MSNLGSETIGKYTTSGATVNASLVPQSGLSTPAHVAVSDGYLFVANAGNGTIGKYTTSGATVNASLISGLNFPYGIAVSGTDLFVTNNSNGSAGTGTIGKYTTSGATVNASLISGLTDPTAIAVSGGNLFVASRPSSTMGRIGKYTTAGATVNASLVTGLHEPYGIDVLPHPLQLVNAFSRKRHGGMVTFDIELPITGEPGVECRTGGDTQNFIFSFTFNNSVVSGSAGLTSGVGSVSGSPIFSGNTMSVQLTGVADVQKITLTLHAVTDKFGQGLPSIAVSANMLIGDTTGNKIVNSSDVSQTKGQSGLAVTAMNFREDINASNSINSSDVSLVKLHSGSSVP